MFDAYIFDLDGTLIDAEKLWVESTRLFLADHGMTLSHEETVQLVYGRALQDIYRDVLAWRPDWRISMDQMNDGLKCYFAPLRAQRDIRIPGSIALLKRLAATHPVCVVSGSPRREVEEGIALTEVASHLAFYFGSEDYTPGKPDPACFLAAAKRLNIPPGRCAVFEDSAAGVLAAKRAGMYCVALVREGSPPQDVSGADQVLVDLDDFVIP